jgi:hypothetical protein
MRRVRSTSPGPGDEGDRGRDADGDGAGAERRRRASGRGERGERERGHERERGRGRGRGRGERGRATGRYLGAVHNRFQRFCEKLEALGMVAKALGKALPRFAQTLARVLVGRHRSRGLLKAPIELRDLLGVTVSIFQGPARLGVVYSFQRKDDVEVTGKCDEGHDRHETHAFASAYIYMRHKMMMSLSAFYSQFLLQCVCRPPCSKVLGQYHGPDHHYDCVNQHYGRGHQGAYRQRHSLVRFDGDQRERGFGIRAIPVRVRN